MNFDRHGRTPRLKTVVTVSQIESKTYLLNYGASSGCPKPAIFTYLSKLWGRLKKLNDAPKPPIVMNSLGAYVRFTITINVRA